MRKAIVSALSVGLLLVGCAGDQTYAARVVQADLASDSTAEKRQYLEREHAVTIDVPADQIESAFQAVVGVCNEHRNLQCTLLDSELTKGEQTTASINARLAPSGVEPFINVAAKHGTVESLSTHTNDLAKPVIDAELRLKMLETYMGDLLRLR